MGASWAAATDAPKSADAGGGSTPGICRPGHGGTGNDLHVGAHCTRGGQECVAYSIDAILVCAIDADPEGGEFCVKIGCLNHDVCGQQGCCTGREDMPTHACVPKGCLTNDDLTLPCPVIPGLRDAGTSTRADGG